MSRLYGYARVSTDGQFTEQQHEALSRAGVAAADVFEDHGVSGFFVPARERPGFQKLMAVLEPGDTIVVWRLDRLGRSVADLIDTIMWLGEKGYAFKSVSESIDTTTAVGKMMFGIFATLAQYERDLTSERTRLAMAEIKAGRRTVGTNPDGTRKKAIGRPWSMSDEELRTAALLIASGMTRDDVAAKFNTNRVTLWRNLRRAGMLSKSMRAAADAQVDAIVRACDGPAPLDTGEQGDVNSAHAGAGEPKSCRECGGTFDGTADSPCVCF